MLTSAGLWSLAPSLTLRSSVAPDVGKRTVSLCALNHSCSPMLAQKARYVAPTAPPLHAFTDCLGTRNYRSQQRRQRCSRQDDGILLHFHLPQRRGSTHLRPPSFYSTSTVGSLTTLSENNHKKYPSPTIDIHHSTLLRPSAQGGSHAICERRTFGYF